MPDKITRCRDNLIRQREEAKKDPKKVNKLFLEIHFVSEK